MSAITAVAVASPAKVQLQPSPVPQLRGTVENSFAYFTLKDRLPVTLDKAVEDVQMTSATQEVQDVPCAQNVGLAISHGIQVLGMELAADAPLFPFPASMTHADTLWNPSLQGHTWFDAPWLTAECYLYRRLHRLFENAGVTGTCVSTSSPGAQYWQTYDVFQRRKEEAFWMSIDSIKSASQSLLHMVDSLPPAPTPYPAPPAYQATAQQEQPATQETTQLKAQFEQVLQNSLWGNQADLSLHTSYDGKHVRKLHQNGSSGSVAPPPAPVPDILVDDFEQIWSEELQYMRAARMDLVLDNAGLELFMDLCLADWLVSAGFAGVCVLHCKQMPWFVSDTTRGDIAWMIQALHAAGEQHNSTALQRLASRWRAYLDTGRWCIQSHPFWTCPLPCWEMPNAAPALFREISRNSRLVFWKGDLNYRRLVGDGDWEYTTPISTAVGLLVQQHGTLCFPPSIILRTCKSDTITGLPQGLSDSVSAWEIEQGRAKYGYEWLTSGRYGMVQLLRGLLNVT